MRRRLLRPRGDAPAFPEFSPISDEAPPPTRRCALLRGDYRSRRGGSSAHAEMRPFRALGRGGGQWLLRPRGDAPRKRSIFDAIERAPPPTRRCALLVRAACDCARGSSAHAEMRPRRSGARRLPLRLLRPRGDAPMRTFEDSKAVRAPPPTRRCARCLDERKAQTIGSSAHAEMRRPQRSVRAERRRLLRPRGDAPMTILWSSWTTTAPPPTRRCAVRRIRSLDQPLGSSAHAEMRPKVCERWTGDGWLLRPRGDAPGPMSSSALASRAPPPTRRCAPSGLFTCGGTGAPPPTRRCAACSRPSQPEPLGSSAHAEMRPWISNRKPIGRWLLRPRGDAPRGRRFQRMARRAPPPTRRCARSDDRRHLVHRGSSAHAEMRPQMSSRTIRGFRLLRPRGDAPATASSCARPEWAPPPTRRCAPSSGARPARPPGSSAHAEMRLRPRASRTRTSRLLRPRGDAPQVVAQGNARYVAPPPRRRCAMASSRRRACGIGSSAHAEMRP